VGNIKGVGHIYQQTFIDTYTKVAFCKLYDRKNAQQALNVARRIALKCVKTRKQENGSKLPLSRIMFDCLLDCEKLVHVLKSAEN